MKFCPFCGATLVGSAVSFCAECGRDLPTVEPSPQNSKRLEPEASPKRGVTHLFTRRAKPHLPETQSPSDPRDEGYDGYYNDVTPADNGHVQDRMNSELIKRIAVIGAIALVVVVLAVVLMNLV